MHTGGPRFKQLLGRAQERFRDKAQELIARSGVNLPQQWADALAGKHRRVLDGLLAPRCVAEKKIGNE